jgi:hypothetical protein
LWWLEIALKNTIYIITTVKHAIWLVNSRAGSGYPTREIKIPSRDFRGILQMPLFHCSYFIKHLPNGFPSRIAWSIHLGCCSTFGKRKNTLACGSSIYAFRKSQDIPPCMDLAILHGKPFGIPLVHTVEQNFVAFLALCLAKRQLRSVQDFSRL